LLSGHTSEPAGRVHLKWSEALLWSGDKPSAEKQFAIA
jgi:hypothetical protein